MLLLLFVEQYTVCSEVNSVYALRSSDSLNVLHPFPQNSTIRNSYSYHGAMLWNNLPTLERKSKDPDSHRRTGPLMRGGADLYCPKKIE